MKDLKPQRITITLSAADADLLEQFAEHESRTSDNMATHMVRLQLGVAGYGGARFRHLTAVEFRKSVQASDTYKAFAC